MADITGHRDEAVPPGRQSPQNGAPRRRQPPRTLHFNAASVRLSPTSYLLHGPHRVPVEVSGRSAEHFVGALRRLDGTVSLAMACRGLSPDEERLFEDLLRQLLPLRMIHKVPFHPVRPRVGVIGEGRCAERLRHVLSDDHDVQGFTEQLPGRQAPPVLRNGEPAPIDRLEHWMTIGEIPLDLVILAGSRSRPDPVMTWQLSRLGIPHLIVTVHRRKASVGPFVQPGLTSCAFCAGGTTVERGHLSAGDAHPTSSALEWAAAIVRSMCLAYSREEIISPTLELGGRIWQSREPVDDCPVCTRTTHLPWPDEEDALAAQEPSGEGPQVAGESPPEESSEASCGSSPAMTASTPGP